MSDILDPNSWRLRQLTHGTPAGQFHQHSYYDIPVVDDASRRVAVTRTEFAGRDIRADDRTTVGYVNLDGGDFVAVGESRAFSLQQGPLAQWLPGSSTLVWNDREDGKLVARLADVETGARRTVPGMIYALAPDGRSALSLDMDRLDSLRPGYGYAGGRADQSDPRLPDEAGVWRTDLETGERRLILSLRAARAILLQHRGPRGRLADLVRRPRYWFNHVKIAPDGNRFTVKLRWRRKNGPWSDHQGVSLTAGLDGHSPRLIAKATSHVIWETPERLFFFSSAYGDPGILRVTDTAPEGRIEERVATEAIHDNVHMLPMPDAPGLFVFDRPYRTDPALMLFHEPEGWAVEIARFHGHDPARGKYRCDLHPRPSPDGRHIIVTSLEDGGRQVYVLSRDPADLD